MTEPQFCLKWNNFHTNLSDVFHNMLLNESMVDVTIACEGASLKAHKMILAACSPFFQSLFISNPCKHPIVILKDIRFVDLKATIDFMYKGEINVTQSQLGSVLKTAETLKIKGLTDVVQRHRDQNPIENEPDNIITADNRDTHLHDSSTHHDVPMVTVTESSNISQLMLEPLTNNQLPGVKRRSIMQRTSAFARVQRYRDETFYEINNVLHCKACGEILNHKKLSVIKHHIESQKHELNKKRMSSSSQT